MKVRILSFHASAVLLFLAGGATADVKLPAIHSDQQARAKAFGDWLKSTGRSDRPTPDVGALLGDDASPANGWVKVKDSGLASDSALPLYCAVWFRKEVTLTAEQARSPQYLYVGFKSADFFQVYVNGKLVEEEDMEDFTRSSGLNSRIHLRPEDMREGVNQLATRVFAPRTPIHLAWAPIFNGKGYGTHKVRNERKHMTLIERVL